DLPADHLEQLDAARGNAGEKRLRGRHRLARTTVLHRAVDDKMICPRAAENSAKGIRRPGLDCILPNVGAHAAIVALRITTAGDAMNGARNGGGVAAAGSRLPSPAGEGEAA